MQFKYDEYLKFWAEKGLGRNGYPKYLKIANRHISFDTHPMDLLKTMYPDEEKSKIKEEQKAPVNETKSIKTKNKFKK